MKLVIKNKQETLLNGHLSTPIIPRLQEAIIINNVISRVIDVKYDFINDVVEIEVNTFQEK